MFTTYPKVCPAWMKVAIDEAIPLASEFLIGKYGNVFDNVHVVFQPNARRSRYYSNDITPHSIYGNVPVATISCRSKLMLYEKKSLGSYRNGVMVGPKIQIACAIVHELTHHYQHIVRKPSGELETTANELEFLKLKFPDWYKIVMISSKD